MCWKKWATCWVHYLGASSLRCLSKLLQPGFLCHSCLSYAFILTLFYSCVFILTVYLRCLSWQSSIPLCLFWLFIFYVYLDNLLFLCVYFDCLSSMFILTIFYSSVFILTVYPLCLSWQCSILYCFILTIVSIRFFVILFCLYNITS